MAKQSSVKTKIRYPPIAQLLMWHLLSTDTVLGTRDAEMSKWTKWHWSHGVDILIKEERNKQKKNSYLYFSLYCVYMILPKILRFTYIIYIYSMMIAGRNTAN